MNSETKRVQNIIWGLFGIVLCVAIGVIIGVIFREATVEPVQECAPVEYYTSVEDTINLSNPTHIHFIYKLG